jgi:acetyltransferase-like isoleucine patch superfamily enzyme
MSYIKNFFSLKRLTYKAVSFLAIWDSDSKFEKTSEVRRFAKLKKSSVGKYSRINPGCIVYNTTVGNFTAIGRDSTIGLGQHPMNYASTQNIFYKKSNMTNRWSKPIDFHSESIKIGSDVWIGMEAMVLDGVTIGHGAVVGARAVVTKNIPPYAVAVGMPAKIIKYRFPPKIIERLLEVAWWDLPETEIDKKIAFFRRENIDLEFINENFPVSK